MDEEQRVLEQLIFSTIENVEVLKRMVKDSPPTLNEVIRILKADEVATLEMNRMVGISSCVHTVNQDKCRPARRPTANIDQKRTTLEKGGACNNCIFNHGSKEECPAKGMECFYCQKTGHMIVKCRNRIAAGRSMDQKPASSRNNTGRSGPKNVHEVEQVEDSD